MQDTKELDLDVFSKPVLDFLATNLPDNERATIAAVRAAFLTVVHYLAANGEAEKAAHLINSTNSSMIEIMEEAGYVGHKVETPMAPSTSTKQ